MPASNNVQPLSRVEEALVRRCLKAGSFSSVSIPTVEKLLALVDSLRAAR